MHGLGNDFVVIDAINQAVALNETQIQFLANRHLGIGCDQLLLVERPTNKEADFKYRIFNADGGEVAQCGNGARCFARFVYDKGLTDQTTIAVETVSGIIYPSLLANGDVRVDMGMPHFQPADIPFIAQQQSSRYDLNLVSGEDIEIGAVSMGNPHAVLLVDDIEEADVARLGPMIEGHKRFPEHVNVGFMQVINPDEIRLRVFERGVGETQACGTGACAAVVSGIKQGLLAREVKVSLLGGELTISWPHDTESVQMTGPTEQVFDGEIAWAMINSQ